MRRKRKNRTITKSQECSNVGDPRYLNLLTELAELHVKKAKDYGTDESPLNNLYASKQLGIEPWKGAILRAGDKLARIQKFAKKGKLANESVIDSFTDLAAYALLARILFEEEMQG